MIGWLELRWLEGRGGSGTWGRGCRLAELVGVEEGVGFVRGGPAMSNGDLCSQRRSASSSCRDVAVREGRLLGGSRRLQVCRLEPRQERFCRRKEAAHGSWRSRKGAELKECSGRLSAVPPNVTGRRTGARVTTGDSLTWNAWHGGKLDLPKSSEGLVFTTRSLHAILLGIRDHLLPIGALVSRYLLVSPSSVYLSLLPLLLVQPMARSHYIYLAGGLTQM